MTGAFLALVLAQWRPTGIYVLPPAGAASLGGVKGTGAALVCSGTDKATGFDAAGALQCGADVGGSASPGGSSGNLQTNNGAGGFGAYAGSGTCSAGQFFTAIDASGTKTCAQPANVTGNAATATALAANANNCSAGQAALGVDASGLAEGCWTVQQPAATTALKAGTVGGAFADYAGASCTNQFPRSSSAAGAWTCATVGVADVAAGGTTPDSSKFWRGDGTWQTVSAGGAPTTAGYWVTVADAGLSAEQAMGSLGTGLVLNTTTTGVPNIYGGTSCTNQFARSLNASGAATCAGIGVADFTANQGTTTQVLHGNASGQPSWGAVTTGDLPTVPVSKGGSNLTTVAADQVYVGTATDTFTAKSLPSCSNGTTSKLLYDTSTHAFSCGTDQGGGGGLTATLLKVTGSDVTNSTTTPGTIFSTSVANATEYGFTCEFVAQGTSTSLPRFNVNGPSASNVAFRTERHTSTSAQTLLVLQAFSAAAQTATCTSSCNATNLPTRIAGSFTTTAAGTLVFQLTSSTSGQSVAVRRGSFCVVY
jgi:hypothetical protein